MARLLRHGGAAGAAAASAPPPPFQYLASGWRQLLSRSYGKRAKNEGDFSSSKSLSISNGVNNSDSHSDRSTFTNVKVQTDAEDELQVQVRPQNNKSRSADAHEGSLLEENSQRLKNNLASGKGRLKGRRSKEKDGSCADLNCQTNGSGILSGCDGSTRHSKPTRTNSCRQPSTHGFSFQHSSTASNKDSLSESKLTEHSNRELRHDLGEPLRENLLLGGLGEVRKNQYFIYQVCVKSIPAYINEDEVTTTLSVYGEIIGSFRKSIGDDSFSVYVQYKTPEAMNKVLATGMIQLGDRNFVITRAKTLNTTVVRLLKVDKHTLHAQIQSICSQFGCIDTIKQHRPGEFDVFYRTNELQNIPRILECLNNANIRQSKWMIAVSAPILHPAIRREVLKSREGQAWHALQRSQAINRIGFGLDTLSVGFEDLRALASIDAL